MNSKTTAEFWECYGRLPAHIQTIADKCYLRWKANPSHPAIRFKPIEGRDSLFSARVGIHYRALAYREGDLVVWVWIGHHSEYDRLLKRR